MTTPVPFVKTNGIVPNVLMKLEDTTRTKNVTVKTDISIKVITFVQIVNLTSLIVTLVTSVDVPSVKMEELTHQTVLAHPDNSKMVMEFVLPVTLNVKNVKTKTDAQFVLMSDLVTTVLAQLDIMTLVSPNVKLVPLLVLNVLLVEIVKLVFPIDT